MINTATVIKRSAIQFGTSGARGRVKDFTSVVCQAFTHAFLQNALKHYSFDCVALGIDNRPSSIKIAKACAAAIENRGFRVHFGGILPTPALAFSAMQESIPAIMVTGSHIPFDRNGLKFYLPNGEISKKDEQAIINSQYHFLPTKDLAILELDEKATALYVKRYLDFFPAQCLASKRIGIYSHSSAGRDLYISLFKQLGAKVIELERTAHFIAIDTEAVSEQDRIKAKYWSRKYQLDAIFSTDGDGDRPLIADENGQWLFGDVLGLLCAQGLNIEAIALPINCNSMICDTKAFDKVTLTKIGSPFVIDALLRLKKQYSKVAGFEANGGFILFSDLIHNKKVLKALPTRDAVLPALMLFVAAYTTSISCLVARLPKRFTYSDRIKNYAKEKSQTLLNHASEHPNELLAKLGLNETKITAVDLTDGLRMKLANESIIHLRPSGNAPELRCYAEAETADRAKALVKQVIQQINK